MCRVLGVAKSGYYAWRKRPKPEREQADAQLAATVAAVHKRSRPTYGSPRVHRELKARGVRVGTQADRALDARKRPARAASNAVSSAPPTRSHGGPIAPNLLARKFDVSEPNRAWVTDVTAIATDEGWLYLAPMLDLCARRVLAWAASEHQRHGARARGTCSKSLASAAPVPRVPAPFRPRQPLRQRGLPGRAAEPAAPCRA